ncbi:hypothetical protein [Aequorivita echinoideorum]|uniref:Abortive infection protein, AbiV family n=1 Tax=Aequorivita echinoideorum TaxID=1549647 RepID=A0ABS5S140_9FLAO|nr:hypothetical protein [Aequorivita echinoideorum]MBT0606938.1 hypothetical protein [Aequorivita echinoideorum]
MIPNKRTYQDKFELFNMALTNAEEQPEIAAAMAQYGYTAARIQEGKDLLETTQDIANTNAKELREEHQSYAEYLPLYTEVRDTYRTHRRLGKVAFKKDHVALSALKLIGQLPVNYIPWLAHVKTFYEGTLSNPNYITKMANFGITEQVLTQTNEKVSQMVNARNVYQKESGEGQDATKHKEEAFENLDEWMSDFYAVARVALREHPQLLESLGKFVRS